MKSIPSERRRRLTHRALPAVAGLAAVSLLAGAMVGASTRSPSERVAGDFADAWARGDLRRMHGLLSDASSARFPLARFRRAYRRADATATMTSLEPGDPEGAESGEVTVPVVVETRVFGSLRGDLRVPVSDDHVDWSPRMVFPELRSGERLRRVSVPAIRATLRSNDGKILAEGPADGRTSPLVGIADSIAGRMEPQATDEERAALYARGFPADWPVGQSGLEEAFEERLRGRPGGELVAGSRVLARAKPRPAKTIRTTIHTGLQEAAVVALAGRFGGVAALDPRNGEIRALAGIAFSAPQPPGSTFKLVTTAAALERGLVKPSTEFPVESHAIIDGVELENANGELCGGTFRNSFAHSCNSVFAPLGLKIGAPALVETAERLGWNAPATIPGEVPSTLPPAVEIDTPLEVASTAIGQFETLATPLQMASVAQVIAMRGVRHAPTLSAGQRTPGTRVLRPRIAHTIGSLMVDVVAYGTGTAAAIPGIQVAGKTGTAELEDTRDPETGETLPPDPTNTDAWFTSYAPAKRPQIVVAVMLVRAGAGGATAAPAARVVLDAAL
ncbi:MAG TPA: penicillin-binding transpeptidase domain-containing protein [Thermoleophilaceae bacterium]|nr:penicillin-binding transpeptidase domain-containing protein [Thermoleophilaceae bacterium]